MEFISLISFTYGFQEAHLLPLRRRPRGFHGGGGRGGREPTGPFLRHQGAGAGARRDPLRPGRPPGPADGGGPGAGGTGSPGPPRRGDRPGRGGGGGRPASGDAGPGQPSDTDRRSSRRAGGTVPAAVSGGDRRPRRTGGLVGPGGH